MDFIQRLLGKSIDIEISGKNFFQGVLIDAGLDLIVIDNGQTFIYFPLVHVQHLKQATIPKPHLEHVIAETAHEQMEKISYRKILDNAKGRFIEIYTENQSFSGYLTSIMNDYFVFHSPVFKTIFVSIDHVKWIIPYPDNLTPYSLDKKHFPIIPNTIPLSRTFKQQCKKLEGHFAVFDLGMESDKVGLVEKVDGNKIELITANGETLLWNLQHLKTFHLP
ncbi:DUF2642 domain-containing protein [Brevibacillus sp. NRS-1366]|uniref:DUF2642 domain-containing protein n=1 Tax=Brevibacillus sp. NRS-1366 TaxID=3233899 RepID=UPI003D23E7B6